MQLIKHSLKKLIKVLKIILTEITDGSSSVEDIQRTIC